MGNGLSDMLVKDVASHGTTAHVALDAQSSGKLIALTLLKRALGFRDCELEALEHLAAVGQVRALGKSEFLVRRGDPFDALCLVVEGALEVSALHQDGRRQLLVYLNPGDMAGIMGVWDGLAHPSDISAREQSSRVLVVPGHEFRRLRDRFPSLSRALELQAAYRSRLLHERMLGDASKSLEVRLARMLYLLASISGQMDASGRQTSVKMSQADIGDFLGVSRQRANAAVHQLRQEGFILQRYAVINIPDLERLKKFADI